MATPSRRMLVCDLDGTLVGDADSTAQLLAWLRPRRPGIVLAYNTGRSTRSACELIAEADLPWPDALVTGLGAAIAIGPPPEARDPSPDPDWRTVVSQGWDAARVEAVAGRFAPALVLQDAIAQMDHKKSFLLHDDGILSSLDAALRASGLHARLVRSGALLDIVPLRAGKQNAVRFLQDRLDVAPGDTVVCGDSENDLDMLSGGSRAIAVGNATAGLLRELDGRVYRAQARAAGGILEGLRHLGW